MTDTIQVNTREFMRAMPRMKAAARAGKEVEIVDGGVRYVFAVSGDLLLRAIREIRGQFNCLDTAKTWRAVHPQVAGARNRPVGAPGLQGAAL